MKKLLVKAARRGSGPPQSTRDIALLALFAFSLQAFARPLAELKQRSLLVYGAKATQFFRADEYHALDGNILASSRG